jgi:hypothetical protein
MAFPAARSARLGALAAAAALALTAIPGAAPQPAEAARSSYALSYQTFPDGAKVAARWNPCQPAITYRVNTKYAGGSKKARKRALRDAKGAVARLGDATGMTFRYRGSTKQIPKDTSTSWASRQKSAEIVIAWVKQSRRAGRTNLLGVSGGRYAAGSGGYAYKFWKVGNDPWSGATGRGFVVLDAAQNKKFKPGFGKGATRGELLLHELGHVVGLNHVTSRKQVMYPTIQTSGSSTYSAGDRAGLRKLGRNQRCIGVPGWVWRDLS